MLLTAENVYDYQSGFAAADTGSPWNARQSWWWREGWNDRAAKWAQIALVVGQPPPAFQPWTTLALSDLNAYQAGYANNSTYADKGNYWYSVGVWDKALGRAARAVNLDMPPPPFNEQQQQTPVFNQQPGQPPPGQQPSGAQSPIYTAYPCWEIAGKIAGKYEPYDTAVKLGRVAQGTGIIALLLSWGVEFELLGPNPGDQRRGYRLSGPSGPVARRVVKEIAKGTLNANPNTYELPAWVGAYWRQGGLRILGAQELTDIGMYDAVINAAL